jgi:sugar phosphate isomerase/epimerase
MKPPLALQLYSVREQIKHDFEGVVRKIAAMGYDGVETAGFADVEPQVAARLFQELDLAVCSAHTPLPTRENQHQVFDVLALLQCQRAVCAWQPPELFESVESIHRVAEDLNAAAELAAEHGVTLHYHNHWFELYPVKGRPALYWLLDELDPAVKLEVDTYWARTGGVDPVALLKELGPRAPLLHIKDGPCTVEDPMVAVGEGVMDIPAILDASNGHAQWLIVELDRCATDMLEAVEHSFQYLSRLTREQY